MVMSVRPSGSPSVRLSVRPSVRVSVRQFSTLFFNMLWHIELKFCIWLYFTVLHIKFECREFPSSFVGVMSLFELTILEIQFPHFSSTCFDILSWNFAYDFGLLYYRSSSSVVTLRQFLWELCPFWNLQYWKYTVFRTFLLHALTYWAQILHMTLLYCTTDQVWVLSICVNFCGSYAPFGTYNTGNTQFSTLFSNMLWHIELKFCIWLWFTVLQTKLKCRHFASIFVGVMPLLEHRILKIHSFPHFSLTCFDILSWNFAHDFVLLKYRPSSSRQFASIFVGVMPLLELRILEIQFFRTFLLHSWNTVFPHFSLTCLDILSWIFSYDFV